MNSRASHPEIVVIGAGLCGLAAAAGLTDAGHSVRVIEARDEPGGRIRSVVDARTGDYLADLGPTWVWPVYQPVVARWIDALDLSTFDQFIDGDSILDYGPDSEPELHQLPSQLGNVRLVGGPQAMIDALVSRLPGPVLASAQVTGISVAKDGLSLQLSDSGMADVKCDRVVVAIPPRIALNTIHWEPELPGAVARALTVMSTWMAPQAKAVALYKEPFWRGRGLSGRILSQVGPLVDAHDHSGPEGTPAALFGFVGWPPQTRAAADPHLEDQIRSQLVRCFGADSPEPTSIHVADWAQDPLVASPRDLTEPMSHPRVSPDILREPYANGRVLFASAETAVRSPGLIEGALDAAERVVAGVAKVATG